MENKKVMEILENILVLSEEYNKLKIADRPGKISSHSHDIFTRSAEEELIIQEICKLLGVNYSYYLHR